MSTLACRVHILLRFLFARRAKQARRMQTSACREKSTVREEGAPNSNSTSSRKAVTHTIVNRAEELKKNYHPRNIGVKCVAGANGLKMLDL
jgi:hypothetical protein